MAENQPPAEPPTPPTGLPALPAAAPLAQPPPGLDADEYRRFQEFQRFQDYQRFVQSQPHRTEQGNQPAPPHQELVTHLTDMRQQLARIERVTNPPLWRKILRSRLVLRLVTLGVVLVVLYIAYQQFFGSDSAQNSQEALHPGTVTGTGRVYKDPKNAVAEFYHVIADGPPNNTTACEVLTRDAAAMFAHDLGVDTCAEAIIKIFGQLSPDQQDAYSNITAIPDNAVVQTGNTVQISSCRMQIGAPPLGLFLLKRAATGEWQVTGHESEPNPCPAPPTTTSAPPTS